MEGTEERRVLAMFCRDLPALRAECVHHPENIRRLVQQMETAAKAGQPITNQFEDLVGTSWKDTPRGAVGTNPGWGHGTANDEQFICPRNACDRVDTPRPAGPIPICHLTGQQFKLR